MLSLVRLLTATLLSVLLAACTAPVAPPVAVQHQSNAAMRPAHWNDLPGWRDDNQARALVAFRASCRVLKKQPRWRRVCELAARVDDNDSAAARRFFRRNFEPWQLITSTGGVTGLITGYYVPQMYGSRQRSERFCYPLYAPPPDLLHIELSSIYPALRNYRLRGRLDGQRVVPYYSRSQIDSAAAPLRGNEILWLDDPVAAFFLHVQGSGRITLQDGSSVMVNYSDQNGHPYRSIGKVLLKRGLMRKEQMSLAGIIAWGKAHPQQMQALLNENPSYIFFRILPDANIMPPGAQGVALTPRRSLAVDTRVIALGTPVFLATTWPDSDKPLQRLMVAQDKGGAITGQVRADFFWGLGDKAGQLAGSMKQRGRMWLLLPRQ